MFHSIGRGAAFFEVGTDSKTSLRTLHGGSKNTVSRLHRADIMKEDQIVWLFWTIPKPLRKISGTVHMSVSRFKLQSLKIIWQSPPRSVSWIHSNSQSCGILSSFECSRSHMWTVPELVGWSAFRIFYLPPFLMEQFDYVERIQMILGD